MSDINNSLFADLIRSLEKLSYRVEFHKDSALAVSALLKEIPTDSTIGIGGSATVIELDLPAIFEREGRQFSFHWMASDPEGMAVAKKKARLANIYLCSANGISEDGQLVFIDGIGNRVSSVLYGHEKVILLCGRNKIAADLTGAMNHAKESAVKNAKRLKRNTPCVKSGVCSNCSSPDRVCRATLILECCPEGADILIYLIDEDLGY